ncbi:unnamed protein product [Gadus morhua 'NCC']
MLISAPASSMPCHSPGSGAAIRQGYAGVERITGPLSEELAANLFVVVGVSGSRTELMHKQSDYPKKGRQGKRGASDEVTTSEHASTGTTSQADSSMTKNG